MGFTFTVLLAAVFVVAGVAKLADREATATSLRGFGISPRLCPSVSVALPGAELVVGLALVPLTTRVIAAGAALVLIGLFLGVALVTLVRGKRPECRCFGQLTFSPIGWLTVVRDAVLLAVAAVVLLAAADRPGHAPSLEAQLAVVAGLAAVVGFGAGIWVVAGLVRQQGRLLLRIEALEQSHTQPGATRSAAPSVRAARDFVLPSLDGSTVSLEQLRSLGHPVLLVFTDPSCAACVALLPDLAAFEARVHGQVTTAVLSRGPAAGYPEVRAHHLATVLTEADAVGSAFGVVATPSAVVVTPSGLIASPLVAGAAAIRSLMARLTSVLPFPAAVASNGSPLHQH